MPTSTEKQFYSILASLVLRGPRQIMYEGPSKQFIQINISDNLNYSF